MANIRQYDAPDKPLEVNQLERGAEAYTTQGRHAEAVWRQAGEAIGSGVATLGNAIQNQWKADEAVQTMKDSQKMMTESVNGWEELLSAGQKSGGKYGPNGKNLTDAGADYFSDFTDKGLKWVDEAGSPYERNNRLESLKQNSTYLRDRIRADSNVMIAQDAERSEREDFTNTEMLVSKDYSPQGVDGILKARRARIEGMLSPDMSEIARQRISNSLDQHEEILRSHAIFERMAAGDIEGAQKDAHDGKYGAIDPESVDKLAETMTTHRDAQIRQNLAAADKANKENIETAGLALDQKYRDPVTGALRLGPTGVQEALKLRLMPGAEKNQGYIDGIVKRFQNSGPAASSNPDTYNDFMRRADLGPDDPEKLTKAELWHANADGQLSDKAFSLFSRRLDESTKDPERSQAHSRMTMMAHQMAANFGGASLLGGADPLQKEHYGQFLEAAENEFDALYKSGGAAAAAQMWDARSQNYVGRLAQPFILSQKGANAPAVPVVTNQNDIPKGHGQPFIYEGLLRYTR